MYETEAPKIHVPEAHDTKGKFVVEHLTFHATINNYEKCCK
jgi:hypothetical protein